MVCRKDDVALVTDPHWLAHAEVKEGETLCGTVSTEDTATVATVVLQTAKEKGGGGGGGERGDYRE